MSEFLKGQPIRVVNANNEIPLPSGGVGYRTGNIVPLEDRVTVGLGSEVHLPDGRIVRKIHPDEITILRVIPIREILEDPTSVSSSTQKLMSDDIHVQRNRHNNPSRRHII